LHTLSLSPPPLFPYTTLFRSMKPPSRISFGSVVGISLLLLDSIEQTPVSGSDSSTLCAPSKSPVNAAAIDRTCSYPVSIRNVGRSEEHTSELQSRGHLVCRLL